MKVSEFLSFFFLFLSSFFFFFSHLAQLLVALFALFATSLASGVSQCMVSSSGCEFYRCLERLYNCNRQSSENRYPISYGLHYCEAFRSLETRGASSAQRRFVSQTRRCLQNSLKSWAQRNPRGTCAALTDFAFRSHPACYTQRGSSICFLSTAEKARVATVVEVNDLFTSRTAVQMASTGAICARQIGNNVVQNGRNAAGKAVDSVRDAAGNLVRGALNRIPRPRLPGNLPRLRN